VYLAFYETFHSGYRVAYSKVEVCDKIGDIQHPLFRHCLELFQTPDKLEIGSFADVPSSGTGMGSSSAFTVALVAGLGHLANKPLLKERIADLACYVEIDLCGDPIGKQDQYASALGGLNHLSFRNSGEVVAIPLRYLDEALDELIPNLHLYHLNMERSAKVILKEQSEHLLKEDGAFNSTQTLVSQVRPMIQAIEERDLFKIGSLLHENWMIKRGLTSISTNTEIDDLYAKALSMGALGGKVLGAGGGGFLLLAIMPELSREFERAFPLKRINYGVDREGVTIIPMRNEA